VAKLIYQEHFWGILAAFIVGIICIAPQIVFIISLGDQYRGIPMMQTPNEEAYLAIIREVNEGHILAASFPFFEYKNSLPLLPPTIPIFYAFFAWLFNLNLVNLLIASKFILPAVLFFLVYLLIYKLEGEPAEWQGKLNAIAGGLAVVLGFDLVDYRTALSFLFGADSPQNFLIWTRPVNPISGAVLLFIFLIGLLELVEKNKKFWIWISGLALALMTASYVFSWTLALAVTGLLGLFYLVEKRFDAIRNLLKVVVLVIIFSLPYWIMVWSSSLAPGFVDAAGRIGTIYTHQPVLNKFLFFVLIIFATASFFFKKELKGNKPLWWLFSAAFILGGFIVYNHQILTGIDVWHYHYVFYTIPLGLVVLSLTLWHYLRPKLPSVWLAIVYVIIFSSSAFGIYTQMAVFGNNFQSYKDFQRHAALTDFLNSSGKNGCVVLSNKHDGLWPNFIPAFTSCDMYTSGEIENMVPRERLYHNYLVLLRLKGVAASEIDSYLKNNRNEAYGFLRSQIFDADVYPDAKFREAFGRLPANYREFLKKDFRDELFKYRLDYILSDGALRETVVKSLSLEKIFNVDNMFLYSFIK